MSQGRQVEDRSAARASEPSQPGRWWTDEDVARFWLLVDRNGPVPAHKPELGACWLFGGQRAYGQFWTEGRRRRRRAHRVSFQFENGPITDAVHVCHHCDVGGCVRPSHVYAGNAKTNGRDRSERPRPLTIVAPAAIRDALERHAHGESVSSIARSLGLTRPSVQGILSGRYRASDGDIRSAKISREEAAWALSMREAGWSRAAIGRELRVSRQAIEQLERAMARNGRKRFVREAAA